MAIFDKTQLKVIAEKGEAEFSKASLNKDLSIASYDQDGKFFYVTMDKVLFDDPVSTIKTVLDAHGFVPNLENILACLDSFAFAAYAKTTASRAGSALKVSEYNACIRFELPQKNRIGAILQSFYDEISKYESQSGNETWRPDPELKKLKDLKSEAAELKRKNKELQEQVSALTLQLNREQKSLSRASRALDSQKVLPDNVRICKVEQVDLKRRTVKLSSQRKEFDVPTHLLDRVPRFQARCLAIFDEEQDVPLGIIFLDNREASDVERRTAELLYVEGDAFKARDSRRNELQVKAVNDLEADTIKSLRRGMKVLVSMSEGHVVHFSVLSELQPGDFIVRVHEQFIVGDIGRNQLVAVTDD
ncbi:MULTISPECIES: hypothetical protein [unclassified Microbulbifer]|uniref:hypothetical protein n=1 Tax=unclassified Microbulbifer TaxID=2619833 RepID=UPI0027E40D1F|nr:MULTISPECIES: hypothetical protein [unclassified Microbulbifer]